MVLGFTITLSQRHGIVQQNGMGRWGDGNGGGIATAWVEIGSDTVDREGGGDWMAFRSTVTYRALWLRSNLVAMAP